MQQWSAPTGNLRDVAPHVGSSAAWTRWLWTMQLCFCWTGEMNPTSADVVSLSLLSQRRNSFSALIFVSQQSHSCTNNTDIKLVLMMPLRLTLYHGCFSYEERSWKSRVLK